MKRNGPPSDIHPVLRRATAPSDTLDLLAQAQRGLDEAESSPLPHESYATAHLAALRTAAAVLAARGRPESSERARRRIRSAWEVLRDIAPELADWSAFFAAGAGRRALAEAGVRDAVSAREARELLAVAEAFLRTVERMLVTEAPLPHSRPQAVGVAHGRQAAGPS